MEERDQWEDEIRSKLRDFEVETEAGDWKAIADRLPGKKVLFSRRWYYVAAGIALFGLMSIGYYYVSRSSNVLPIVAHITEAETPDKRTEQPAIETSTNDVATETGQPEQIRPVDASRQTWQVSLDKGILESAKTLFSMALLPVSPKPQIAVKNAEPASEILESLNQVLSKANMITHVDDFNYLADAAPAKADRKSVRRWGVGAGGGSYSVGTHGDGFVSNLRTYSASYQYWGDDGEWYMEAPVKRDDYFNELLAHSSNSEYHTTSVPKVGLTHKQPIAFGIGIGYALNDCWSLQSGPVYTLLSSEWRTDLPLRDKFKQQLHFMGVPLGVSYQIAEWNKIRFYATAGGLAEWNMSGHVKTHSYSMEKEAWLPEKEAIRMKELQWSVHTRVGATYPVIRFVNAYVEGGANYYFNNKSSIETVRSDKPFHVSLQAGLRVGF